MKCREISIWVIHKKTKLLGFLGSSCLSDLLLLCSSNFVYSCLELFLWSSCFRFLVYNSISCHLMSLVVFLSWIQVIINACESGCWATSESSSESINTDAVFVFLVNLCQLLSYWFSRWISCIWMWYFNSLNHYISIMFIYYYINLSNIKLVIILFIENHSKLILKTPYHFNDTCMIGFLY